MIEEQLKKEAITYIKSHKHEVIEKFANLSEYPPDLSPFSIFMAGSPGAGKTEFSIALRNGLYEKMPDSKIVRIDADEIREIIPQYNKKNSHVIQAAASVGVEKLIDYIHTMNQNAIVDGTFAHYETSIKNIKRSLKRNRKVEIWYLYLDPKVAWDFTRKREKLEGRPIRKEDFINAVFSAKENVNRAKLEFGKQIELNLVVKSIVDSNELHLNIDNVDNYLSISYNRTELEKILL